MDSLHSLHSLHSLQRLRLQIVPADSVRAHEIADPGREQRIEQRLREDSILRDPLMAGALRDIEGYVLLDGTNRKLSLANIGLPYVLAQVIDYADEHAVTLRTWSHAASLPLRTVLERAADIPGARLTSLSALEAADALRRSGTIAVLLNRDEQYALVRDGETGPSRAEQLRALVDIYEAHMQRIDVPAEEVEEHAQSLGLAENGNALIAFPPFSRSQVVTMAMRGALIPAGITRHVVGAGRALRVNVPLDLLSGSRSLEEANSALASHIEGLHPRLYREPTILFDS